MTPSMKVEFQKIFQAEREERGMIGARSFALGLMLHDRRKELSEWLGSFDGGGGFSERAQEIARLTAECTLLMIERGA